MAAGPKYGPSVQYTGHDVVQQAQRMHLVVSSKMARSVGRLDALLARLMAIGDEERQDGAVGGEEGLHVDDEVLLERQALDRLDV
jgi:hypothetical protein